MSLNEHSVYLQWSHSYQVSVIGLISELIWQEHKHSSAHVSTDTGLCNKAMLDLLFCAALCS